MEIFFTSIKKNTPGGIARVEKHLFTTKDQAEKFVIKTFSDFIGHFSFSALHRVCEFLIVQDKRDLLLPLIMEEFKNSFEFSIEKLKLEGHVLG